MRVTVLVHVMARTEWSELVAERLQSLEVPDGVEVDYGLLCEPGAIEAGAPFERRLKVSMRRQIPSVQGIDSIGADVTAIVDDRTLIAHRWLKDILRAVERHPDADTFVGRTSMFMTSLPTPEVVSAFPEFTTGFAFAHRVRSERLSDPPAPFLLTNVALRRRALVNVSVLKSAQHSWVLARSAGHQVVAPSITARRFTTAEEATPRALASYLTALGAASAVEVLGESYGRTPLWVWRQVGEAALGFATSHLIDVGPPPHLRSGWLASNRLSKKGSRMVRWRELQFLLGVARRDRVASTWSGGVRGRSSAVHEFHESYR
jgi:hypothetical protein